MQTILVTGASGFVGSRFLKRWAAEYNILAPSHAELDITDDASVVEALGEQVVGVEGNRENIKLTTPFDLMVAKTLMECWTSQHEI